MTINFEILQNYVPQESLPILQKWFNQRPFELRIPKKRTTKFGDFRASTKQLPNRISVNSNLNKYAFLITLTHEFAHLLVWLQHQHKVKAHGLEWKTEFATLMNVLLTKKIFPQHLELVLQKHLKNPPASSARDVDLINELKKYDAPSNTIQLIEIAEGTSFVLNNKRIFIKGKKRRTRYLCKEISTKKEYLIHGVAEVELLNVVNN
ncbi:MAG: SprT-like domain-containing protein [Flavobacteriales bacterium]|nr:SprT-like domain-containing protein [Flavobacteriales bacterium]